MPQTIAIMHSPETGPWWLTRSFRVLLAQFLLLLAGAASLVLVIIPIEAIAFGPWPANVAALRIRWLGYISLELIGILGLIVTSYGFMLGRRQWGVKVGKLEANASGDQDGADPSAGQAG